MINKKCSLCVHCVCKTKVHTDLDNKCNSNTGGASSLLNGSQLPTCAGGTGPMAVLTGPSVAVVISPWVTGHLTLVSLKTVKEKS